MQWAVVRARGERRLTKTVQREWMRGKRKAMRGAGGEGGGRTRQEQRTGTRQEQRAGDKQSQRTGPGGFLQSRREKERPVQREIRGRETGRMVGVKSSGELDMEIGEGAMGGVRKKDQTRNEKKEGKKPAGD